MPLIKINGITYEFDKLTEEVKGHLRYLSFLDAELEQSHMRLASMRIAREEVGRRLDQALVHQSIIQSTLDVESARMEVDTPEGLSAREEGTSRSR